MIKFIVFILLIFGSVAGHGQRFTFEYIDVGQSGGILRGKKANAQQVAITASEIIYTNEKGKETRFMIHRRDELSSGHSGFMVSCACTGSFSEIREAHLLSLGRNKTLFIFFKENGDFIAFGNHKFYYNPQAGEE
ncbi:MAG: hypothetical protein ACK4EX_07310 [Thermaurantimonas sp.]|uniref:hypothetical protein n=1 Tax=Thermaurantimonas sp. TaxID=2681568 RepID=UPI00391A93FB